MSKNPVLPRGSLLAGLALAALACEPALANGFGEDSSLPLVDRIIDWIGFRDLTGDRRDLFAYCLLAFAFAFGIVTDMAFRDRGFGKALNGVIGAAGICIALHFIAPHASTFGGTSETVRFNLTMIAAGAGSALTLVIAAALKGVAMRALRLNLDRLDRAPPPKPLKTEARLDPRIASALREKI